MYDVLGMVRERKAQFREAQIRRKGRRIAGMAQEAAQAKRYNALEKTERKLEKEIDGAKKAKRERGQAAKFRKAKANFRKFQKESRRRSNSGGVFMNGGSMGPGFGRGPFG